MTPLKWGSPEKGQTLFLVRESACPSRQRSLWGSPVVRPQKTPGKAGPWATGGKEGCLRWRKRSPPPPREVQPTGLLWGVGGGVRPRCAGRWIKLRGPAGGGALVSCAPSPAAAPFREAWVGEPRVGVGGGGQHPAAVSSRPGLTIPGLAPLGPSRRPPPPPPPRATAGGRRSLPEAEQEQRPPLHGSPSAAPGPAAPPPPSRPRPLPGWTTAVRSTRGRPRRSCRDCAGLSGVPSAPRQWRGARPETPFRRGLDRSGLRGPAARFFAGEGAGGRGGESPRAAGRAGRAGRSTERRGRSGPSPEPAQTAGRARTRGLWFRPGALGAVVLRGGAAPSQSASRRMARRRRRRSPLAAGMPRRRLGR